MKDRILEQRLRKIGFKDFEIVDENSEFEEELEHLELKYLIDILPFRLQIEKEQFYEETLQDEIPKTSFNDLENFYCKKEQDRLLQKKWISILLKFSYYFKLKNIYLFGLGVHKDKKIQKLYDDEGFYLKYKPIHVMNQLEHFISFGKKELKRSSFVFEFENQVEIHIFCDELFMGIYSKDKKEIESNMVKILEMLVQSEGLFLHE